MKVSSFGKYNKDSGVYEVTVDVSKDVELHLNGDYVVAVHAADYRAEKAVQWSLGKVKLWYKEGHEEGVNNGIKADYQPLPTIEFVYPPEAP